MSYREMAIDAGARGEEEIRRMAAMIEEEHRRSQYDQWAAEAQAQAEAEAMAEALASQPESIRLSPDGLSGNLGETEYTTDGTTAVLRDTDYITDGYQTWPKRCAMCGQDTMQVVRPGKVQCSECG